MHHVCIVSENEVLELQVAMGDALAVDVGDSCYHLVDEVGRLVLLKAATGLGVQLVEQLCSMKGEGWGGQGECVSGAGIDGAKGKAT